jgi:hypothetical protein
MLKHQDYDKVKVLYELSKLLWFIKKHGEPDTNTVDTQAYELFENLGKDLDKYIEQLRKMLY